MKFRLAVFVGLFLVGIKIYAQPTPYPANPQIQSLAEQISADSIFSTISRLAAFQTRHTYSDTTSDSVGIGAAIRWVESKIHAYQDPTQLVTERWPWTHTWEGQNRTRHLLIARQSGIFDDSSRYLIGGHLDSRTVSINDESGLAPGSDDNASSCAVLLEIARLLPDTLLHNLELIWFTGEEEGLWGSQAYASQFQNSNRRIDGMIAMDMVSHISNSNGVIDSTSMRLYAQGDFDQGSSASVSRNFQRYVKWVGESYLPDFTMQINAATDRPGRGSDHISFSEVGYPAIRHIERNEDLNYQHNSNDQPNFLSPSYARKIAIVTYGALTTALKAPARTPSPTLSWLGEGQIQVTIPDSVSLPEGGHFFIAYRNFTNNYLDQVFDIDTARSFVFHNAELFQSYCFAVSRSNREGFPSPFSTESILDVTSAEETVHLLPQQFSLSAYPNPFNNEVSLEYYLPHTSKVKLRIFDELGRENAMLVSEIRRGGVWRVVWKPLQASSGLYFAELETDLGATIQKLHYLK